MAKVKRNNKAGLTGGQVRDPFAPQSLSEESVRERLRDAVNAAGGQRAYARQHEFSAAYVNDVLHGRRAPAENICAALGIKRRVIYAVEYKLNTATRRSRKS